MGKHKSDKVSQKLNGNQNKAGGAPQVPRVGSEQHNSYNNRSRR